jgi:tRNA (mo5U34)-methyltransferase
MTEHAEGKVEDGAHGGTVNEAAATLTKPHGNSPSDLQAEVDRYNWAQSIDLGNGVVTKGIFGDGRPNPIILRALDDIQFAGKKVLEIGCWDGMWSFEAEKRGASVVYATDLVTQRPFADQPTFQLAHRVLKSKVIYNPAVSVYDVESLGIRDFDVVIFCGVFYHLKDPLRALCKLRKVTKTGGTILVEGEAIYGPTETFARFYYRTWLNEDASNWWVPTIPCLREWIECNFFACKREYALDVLRPGWPESLPVISDKATLDEMLAKARTLRGEILTRYLIAAEAVVGHDPNYGAPDEELGHFAGWKK